MPNEEKLGISTGIKLGIGGCIGVIIALVGCALVLYFFGSAFFNVRPNPADTSSHKQSTLPDSKMPTVSQLIEEANTIDQQSKLDGKYLQLRLEGHKAGSESMKKKNPDVESSLEGPNKTIWVIRCAQCDRDFVDGFFQQITPDFRDKLTDTGITHLVITDGYSTAIKQLKNNRTRYFNEAFQTGE